MTLGRWCKRNTADLLPVHLGPEAIDLPLRRGRQLVQQQHVVGPVPGHHQFSSSAHGRIGADQADLTLSPPIGCSSRTRRARGECLLNRGQLLHGALLLQAQNDESEANKRQHDLLATFLPKGVASADATFWHACDRLVHLNKPLAQVRRRFPVDRQCQWQQLQACAELLQAFFQRRIVANETLNLFAVFGGQIAKGCLLYTSPSPRDS